jgi:hypothetical protein
MNEPFTPILTIKVSGTRVGIETHDFGEIGIPSTAQFGMLVGVFDWIVNSHPESSQNEVESELIRLFGLMIDERHEFLSREKQ